MLPSETTQSGVEKVLGPLPEALLRSREKVVVLVLDEYDKTRPSADALLLDFLQHARLSVRMSAEERIITGRKENLIVFLTSNDEREFSEPLLRRCVTITIPHLSVQTIMQILQKHVDDENLVLLLTQLYIDTIQANLRKPATIQELLQLAEAIKALGAEADFTTLVRAFVIKYDDDFSRFTKYVASREPYQFMSKNEKARDASVDISSHYDYKTSAVIAPPAPAQEARPRMPALMTRNQRTFTEETQLEIPPS
ncbi:MAG: hypothetical protein NZ953_04505, partial [Thaumarchaeota archaeon]|nr:hypothetical protein [Candidatus Calditenuaceae archaeon]